VRARHVFSLRTVHTSHRAHWHLCVRRHVCSVCGSSSVDFKATLIPERQGLRQHRARIRANQQHLRRSSAWASAAKLRLCRCGRMSCGCTRAAAVTCGRRCRARSSQGQPCNRIGEWTSVTEYHEGVWTGIVLMIFTALALLFNGVVVAM
jgi:hypothetical protein